MAASDNLTAVSRFVPSDLLSMIGSDVERIRLGDHIERRITVLFSDIRDFTQICETQTPAEVFQFMNEYLEQMIPVIEEHRGIIDKFIGDAIMALFGFSADNALQAANEMLIRLRDYSQNGNLQIGIGLNTGIVMLGTVGSNTRMETTVLGDAVNIASRIEGLTKLYQTPLLISEDTLLSLENPQIYAYRFVDRVRVKGKLHPLTVYEVFNHQSDEIVRLKRKRVPLFEKAVAFYHLQEVERAIPILEECLHQCPNDNVAQIYLERCQQFLQSGFFDGTGEIQHHLQWNDLYLLNIEPIDLQHQRLFSEFNHLSRAIRHQQTETLPGILDFMADYALEHFQTEEQMMQEYCYPLYEEHAREHRNFIHQFTKVREQIESNQHDGLYLLFQVNLFLVDWLVNHTTRVDKHMGHFINRQHPTQDLK